MRIIVFMAFIRKFKISTRIYFTMAIVVLFSFIAIGLTTHFFFKEQNELYHQSRLLRKERAVVSAFQYFLEKQQCGEYHPFFSGDFQEKVKELADVHNVDLAVYDLSGNLITSSSKDPRYINLLPDSISQKQVDYLLENLGESETNVVESRVLLSSRVVTNFDSEPMAIINILYLKSQTQNEQQVDGFLWLMVRTYLILLLISVLLGYILSRYIVKSLKSVVLEISKSKKEGFSEKLEWHADDEIGELVKAYNKKVAELEESAQLLAQTERESAWRDVARQVAHEIKNPLTPMKLQLQQLERWYRERPEEFEERFLRFKDLMIEQIEALSRMATAFSNFANMPVSEVSSFDIVTVIRAAVDLFSDESEGIKFEMKSDRSYKLRADKEQLLQVFNNLIKNAIEATEDDCDAKISISIDERDSLLVVKVSDEGCGIPEDKIDSIFVPNFTTKSSGSGLGLAMSKRIIEQLGGQITVESEVGKGTTFTLYIPKNQSL